MKSSVAHKSVEFSLDGQIVQLAEPVLSIIYRGPEFSLLVQAGVSYCGANIAYLRPRSV